MTSQDSKAVAILGMHRSGTSVITRAFNLLGTYLGQDSDLMPATLDNAEGYWERLDVCHLHAEILAALGTTWDTAAPLPCGWQHSETARRHRREIKRLVGTHLAPHRLWAWKDPRSCLLMPLWREALEEMGIKLACVFAVRHPLEVALSLRRRDGLPLDRALGIWFNYNLAALEAIEGLPTAFLSYERFLESWESELRRCARPIGVPWPGDAGPLRQAMETFLRPGLRHSRSGPGSLANSPRPVQELYDLLVRLAQPATVPQTHQHQILQRLGAEFRGYASFFHPGLGHFSAYKNGAGDSHHVAFVVRVVGHPEHTAGCLDSLHRAGVPDRAIVLADTSRARAVETLARERPELRVVCNPNKETRAVAWNHGLGAAAPATWTFVVNNDVVVGHDLPRALIEFAEEGHWDIASPAVIEGDLDYDFEATAAQFLHKMRSVSRPGGATGVCFVIHRRVIDRIRAFDPHPGLVGYENEDLFRRARKAGFRLATSGRALAHHFCASNNSMRNGRADASDEGKAPERAWRRRKHGRILLCYFSERFRWKVRGASWRRKERRQFGLTLRMRRGNGTWHWL